MICFEGFQEDGEEILPVFGHSPYSDRNDSVVITKILNA